MDEKSPISFLRNFHNYYLTDDSSTGKIKPFIDEFDISDIVLYRIKRITYEEKSPSKEALENVISSIRLNGVNLIYLILSDGCEVRFYLGVSRDLYDLKKKRSLSVKAIGDHILKPSIAGNYRGSLIDTVTPTEKREVMKTIIDMKEHGIVEGVPGLDEDKEDFQAIDRLVDIMCGDEFGIMVVANAYTADEIFDVQRKLEQLYTLMYKNVKRSVQESQSKGESHSSSTTSGNNSSNSKGQSDSTQTGSSKGQSYTTQNSTQTSQENGKKSSTSGDSNTQHSDTNSSTTKQTSINTTTGTSNSTTEQNGSNSGESQSITIEEYNKSDKDWIEYFDKILFPRIDYAKGRGMFSCCVFLFTKGIAQQNKLSNAYVSLFSGSEGNRVPLRYTDVNEDDAICQALMRFQIPMLSDINIESKIEEYARAALSQSIDHGECRLGNWYSANELCLICNLPQKEVHGISLKQEVEFGLNYGSPLITDDSIQLGSLVEAGVVLDTPVSLDKKVLNKHTFVTGVTGSGKTTTCHTILIESHLPFIVIEPAKTEYRILRNEFPNDFIIFTLGNDSISPFRLNPFEFFPHESITAHVDMVKASIEAAFDMEAAIPQIIESAIYKAYQQHGWDITTNNNSMYSAKGLDPFSPESNAFPTLSEVINLVEQVVQEQGFDARLKNDYIGSIKARLQSLTLGAKGMMLDTLRSYNLRKLLKMHVVLEIEDIKSGNEKAFVMGLIMSQLNEAIKAEFMDDPNFRHITLIEEAHRLLAKYTPGDSPNKRHGTEVFADMLAEIRKYGECFIIADQIPDKMIPEVLKNTNTKIVHRLFAKDDKDAIGNTMSLTDEQRDYLSLLEVGRAIVFSQNYEKAIQVQIKPSSNTTAEQNVPTDNDIHKISNAYLFANLRSGIVPGMQFLDVTEDEFPFFYKEHKVILNCFEHCLRSEKRIDSEKIKTLCSFIERFGIETTACYFAFQYRSCFYQEIVQYTMDFLGLLMAQQPGKALTLVKDKDFFVKRKKHNDYIRK